MAYVYRHIRVDKNEPFYIGIGKDDGYEFKRAYYKSIEKRNKIWIDILRPLLLKGTPERIGMRRPYVYGLFSGRRGEVIAIIFWVCSLGSPRLRPPIA